MSENPSTTVATSAGADEIRHARAWLSRAVEPGDPALYRALTRWGPVETVRRLRENTTGGIRPGDDLPQELDDLRRRTHQVTDAQVTADLRIAADLGARLVTPEDGEWPGQRLKALAADDGSLDLVPPVALWVQGPRELNAPTGRDVAIVGTRAATAYGERVAADLAYALADSDWTVISGGAYGIDGAAHRGALVRGGVTVAVLGSGLRWPQPAGHASLFASIRAGGSLVSEWPPDAGACRQRLMMRNRLIAGLSAGVVVVEALPRSGAVSIGSWAVTFGRPLMVVPGPVTSAASAGCHLLLRRGQAQLVTNAEQVIHALTS